MEITLEEKRQEWEKITKIVKELKAQVLKGELSSEHYYCRLCGVYGSELSFIFGKIDDDLYLEGCLEK